MRYLVFAYHRHYPNGGADDLLYTTNNLVDAKHKSYDLTRDENYNYEYSHVFDNETLCIVYNSDNNLDMMHVVIDK